MNCLYLSAAIGSEFYKELQKQKLVSYGFQAQKFNSQVISGLSRYGKVHAVSILPVYSVKRRIIQFGCIIEDGIEYKAIPIVSIPFFHKVVNLFCAIKYSIKLIKRNQCNVIIADALSLSATVAACIASYFLRVQRIAIVTDIPEMAGATHIGIQNKLIQWLMTKYDKYVFLTEPMNEIVNIKHRPYIVVEGLCGVVKEDAGQEPPQDTMSYCMFAGSLSRGGSRIMEFIRAFIKASILDLEFHIYGMGNLVDEIKSICKEHINIKYLGFATNDEILQQLRFAEFLVNPRNTGDKSAAYSFPSKIIEYMASGRPLLTTRLKGIPYEYEPYLFYIESETEDGYLEAIKRLHSLPEEEKIAFGQRAKKFVIKKKNGFAQAQRIDELAKNHVNILQP